MKSFLFFNNGFSKISKYFSEFKFATDKRHGMQTRNDKYIEKKEFKRQLRSSTTANQVIFFFENQFVIKLAQFFIFLIPLFICYLPKFLDLFY